MPWRTKDLFGVAALQQRPPIRRGWHLAYDDAFECRQRTRLPVIESAIDRFLAWFPRLNFERATSCSIRLEPFRGPGIIRGGVLLRQLGVHNDRHRYSQIGHGQLILAQEIDAEGVIIDDDELLGLFERPSLHLEGWEAANRHGTVKGPFHIVSCDWRTIVEFRLLTERKRHRHTVWGDLPTRG